MDNLQIDPKLEKLIRQIEKDAKEIDEMVPVPGVPYRRILRPTFWERLIDRIKYELGLFHV